MSVYVYIAGPYTQGDCCVNIGEAIKVAEQLVALGYIPYIPHLTHLWHLIHNHSLEFWYAYDKLWIPKCNCMIRIPGPSNGADREVEAATFLEKPVFYSVEELDAYYKQLVA